MLPLINALILSIKSRNENIVRLESAIKTLENRLKYPEDEQLDEEEILKIRNLLTVKNSDLATRNVSQAFNTIFLNRMSQQKITADLPNQTTSKSKFHKAKDITVFLISEIEKIIHIANEADELSEKQKILETFSILISKIDLSEENKQYTENQFALAFQFLAENLKLGITFRIETDGNLKLEFNLEEENRLRSIYEAMDRIASLEKQKNNSMFSKESIIDALNDAKALIRQLLELNHHEAEEKIAVTEAPRPEATDAINSWSTFFYLPEITMFANEIKDRICHSFTS